MIFNWIKIILLGGFLAWLIGHAVAADCHGLLLEKSSYEVCYNLEAKIPYWTHHYLAPADIAKRPVRTNDFRADTELPEEARSTNRDYLRSGYDRGHHVPASDRGNTKALMSETFLLSNMSPQTPNLNRVFWRTQVEMRVRKLVLSENCTAEIYTGTVVVSREPLKIGQVTVPTHLYKAISCNGKGYSLLVPNASRLFPQNRYATPLDAIETLTGLDFFDLPEEEEAERRLLP